MPLVSAFNDKLPCRKSHEPIHGEGWPTILQLDIFIEVALSEEPKLVMGPCLSYSKAWFGFRMGVGNMIELSQKNHGLSPSCKKLVPITLHSHSRL